MVFSEVINPLPDLENKKMKYHRTFWGLLVLLLGACGHTTKKTVTDTPNSGKISVGIALPVQKLGEDEIFTFTQNLSGRATIQAVFGNDDSLMQLLLNQEIRLLLSHEDISQKERKQFFEQFGYEIKSRVIAHDAVALVVHENMKDTLSISQIKKAFSGEIKNWAELGPNFPSAPVAWIFDHPNSQIFAYLKKNLGGITPTQVFSVNGPAQVISEVKKRPGAIGVLGLSWVSDGNDPSTGIPKSGYKIVAIQKQDSTWAVKPTRKNILKNRYPWIRSVYTHLAEPYSGLGTGFIAYICSQPGQIIVDQRGLLPGTLKTWIRDMETQTFNPKD